MKKKLAYIFAIISSIILIMYLLRYKQALNYENKIPISATEIVQVNLRAIEHHLLIDAIKNPLKYIRFKSKSKSGKSFMNTIEIPKSLFLFTNKSNFKGAWFSNPMKLKNNAKLQQYLAYKAFKKQTVNDLELFSKGSLTVAIYGENVIIAYKKRENAAINNAIQTVFNETRFYNEDTYLITPISNSKSDIVYANIEEDFLEANFKNGLFEIIGKVQSDLFIADTNSAQTENAIGFISTKINKNHPIFKSFTSQNYNTKFQQFTKLSLDSIVKNWNGSVVVNLKSIETKTDTIVTYEYDDNFNKKEIKSIQKLSIPDAAFFLGSNKDLSTYFHNANTIKIIENDTLFTSIPLYKWYVKEQENGLHFFTQKPVNTNALKNTDYKFKMSIDVNTYLKNPLEWPLLPIKNEYLPLIKNISATLTTTNELNIHVRLNDDRNNFLYQFIH